MKTLRVWWMKPVLHCTFSFFQAERHGTNSDLVITHDHAKNKTKIGTDGNFVVKLHPRKLK